MSRVLSLVALLAAACNTPPATPSGKAATDVFVEGRVVDDHGVGVANVSVRLVDTTRLSGHVDKRGCGTHHPQTTLMTDEAGRFSGTIAFQPTTAQVDDRVEWLELPRVPQRVVPGAPIVLMGRSIPHRYVEGVVVDPEGQPVKDARIQPGGGMWIRTGADGSFTLELAVEHGPSTVRVRRMGFRPVEVPVDELARVVLARRPMITVTVLDPATNEPTAIDSVVSLWQRGERLSFCTAGLPEVTHEPTRGTCALDAEPGTVELRVDDKALSMIQVTEGAAQAVTVTSPPRRPLPPVVGNPY